MAGLILAFLFRAGEESGDGILTEGLLCGARALVWFAAFAILHRLPWTGSSHTLALTAGVTILLLNLLVSGGISLPSVAQPLWIMAALALNAVRVETSDTVDPSGSWIRRAWPALGTAGLAAAYLLLIYYPVAGSINFLSEARLWMPGWQTKLEQVAREASREGKVQAMRGASDYLKTRILNPLRKAAELDPGNVLIRQELSTWYGEQARLSPGSAEVLEKALREAKEVERLDPDSKDGYLAEYRARMLMTFEARDNGAQARKQAAKALRGAVQRDPSDAPLRYQLAESLFEADERDASRAEATKALELDNLATEPDRKLDDAQRSKLREWLEPSSVK
jgi:hypothetical protein